MKSLVVLVLVSFGLFAQAGEMRGQVLSIVGDDDGQKIILSSGSEVGTAYLKNSHPSFEPLSDLVVLAKESNKPVVIKVDDEYLKYVKSIKTEK